MPAMLWHVNGRPRVSRLAKRVCPARNTHNTYSLCMRLTHQKSRASVHGVTTKKWGEGECNGMEWNGINDGCIAVSGREAVCRPADVQHHSQRRPVFCFHSQFETNFLWFPCNLGCDDFVMRIHTLTSITLFHTIYSLWLVQGNSTSVSKRCPVSDVSKSCFPP